MSIVSVCGFFCGAAFLQKQFGGVVVSLGCYGTESIKTPLHYVSRSGPSRIVWFS